MVSHSLHWSWWALFNLFVIAMLVVDLKVFHRKPREVTIRGALLGTAFWVALALAFNLLIYFLQDRMFPLEIRRGYNPALEFFTGYLIEESLSVDNLFVFLLLFHYFKVPARDQRNVLLWGILGAIVMRAAFIIAGVEIIQRLHWAMYLFGAFLVYTGIRMAFHGEKEVDPEKNPVFRFVKRFFPLTDTFEKDRFFVRRGRSLLFTPLFVVLVVVETTDIVFAVDSIPAVLGVTLNPFIAYTSNLFAVLGLRSIYFALARMMELFHYLKHGLSVVLVFVGVKMLVSDLYKIPIGVALAVVLVALAVSVILSLAFPRKLNYNP